MVRNYFDAYAAGQQAFSDTYDTANAITDRRTQVQAGRALAGGDRAGAAAMLNRGGRLGAGRQVEADTLALEDREAERAAGAQELEAKVASRRASTLKMFAQGLTKVPPGQRKARLDSLRPVFEQIGVDYAPFEGLREEDLTDEALQIFGAEMEKAAVEIVNRGNGAYDVVDKNDRGRVIRSEKQFRKPLIVPQTSDVFMPEEDEGPAGGMGGDTIAGGSGDSGLAGGSGRDMPGYRLVRPGRAPATGGGQGPAQWVTMPEAESSQYGPGKFQKNTRTGEVKPISSTGKEPTVEAKKATAFAYRTLRANDRMNSLAERNILKPTMATETLFNVEKNGVLRLVARTEEDRLFFQASKEWLAPILRKDTGAAVTDQELASYMDIYIPRFEDSPAVIRQKAEARHDAMLALVRESGPLYDQTHGPRKFKVRFAPEPQRGAGRGGSRPPLSSFERR